MREIVFWVSLGVVFYVYLGYGMLLYIWAIFLHKPVRKAGFTPLVNVVIVARDEEANIREKIVNILEQDYPKGLLTLFVVSDGSSDRTPAIVKEFKGGNVELIELKERAGKAEALNRAIASCDADFVVLADSRQRFERNALRELMSNFADGDVGAASGELLFKDDRRTTVGEGLGFYWSYEKFLRRMESRIDSTCGTTGAIYAIRKRLFRPMPADTLLDDVVIPMEIVMQGSRSIFEPGARAFDEVADTPAKEARRKIRTIAGNFQMFFRHNAWLDPFKNRIWLQTFSHKFLRLAAPIFLAALLVSSLLLIKESAFCRLVFHLQVIFYALGVIGIFLQRYGLRSALCAIPLAFVMLNYFTVRAFFEFLSIRPRDLWATDK